MNILTYAETKKQSFKESPFNRIDAVILCWLSYYTYPDYTKDGNGVALKDLQSRGLLPDKQMYAEAYNPKKSKRLFTVLADSPRFENLEFYDFCDERSESEEKQFAAICIKFDENKYFVAFRGTDPSFTGWKEDFNLACCYPIPSQQTAAEYLKAQMNKFPGGEFYCGGHSKGGNIAVYAAVYAGKNLQKRIINVFNFDGPGFINDIYVEEGFENIADRVIKIVPQSSFVGMLFETRECYSIIKSRNLSILQHDPFSWVVLADDYQYLKDRSKFSVKLEKAINNWLAEIPIAERERMIILVHGAITSLNMKDVNEFTRTLYRQIPVLYRQYKALEQEDKVFFDEKITRLKQLFDSKQT